MTADLRARGADMLDHASRGLAEACAAAGRAERVAVRVSEFWRSPPTPFADAVIETVDAAAKERGFSRQRLWAGAGHDAKYVADQFPAGMIFVPSAGGTSHHEREWTEPEDCARGVTVLLDAVRRLAGQDSRIHEEVGSACCGAVSDVATGGAPAPEWFAGLAKGEKASYHMLTCPT